MTYAVAVSTQASLARLRDKGVITQQEYSQAVAPAITAIKRQNTVSRKAAITANDWALFNKRIDRNTWLVNNRDIEREYGN